MEISDKVEIIASRNELKVIYNLFLEILNERKLDLDEKELFDLIQDYI